MTKSHLRKLLISMAFGCIIAAVLIQSPKAKADSEYWGIYAVNYGDALICDHFTRHGVNRVSFTALGNFLMNSEGYSSEEAGKIVTLSTQMYCPEHIPAINQVIRQILKVTLA
ncbi:hypothetical protein HWB90_gp061 [Mycobacterium phage Fowlmouth]|uniref:Membrane protein n=2 Tax=Fowlmouthvirus fowlmouth TaxID=2845652 RepID=A0A7G8LPV2_9CAUD|nr:hypothetical protein HWB90_gp061 [Mycobacterium phage Fowlmouth]AYN58011.1 hypothetical protein SEA_FOWLMOUTH_61 [Mycobacterium phage Fowlmouth]QNJ59274.1 membrane protein [Mycobacterium phage MrMiyagi]